MSLSLVLPLNLATIGLESFSDEATTEAVQQNFRMLLLTSPGEYVMDVNFGVGLRNYLFQLASDNLADVINAEILKQCNVYMPYVQINKIDVDFSLIDSNTLSLRIEYNISESVLNQILEITTSA